MKILENEAVDQRQLTHEILHGIRFVLAHEAQTILNLSSHLPTNTLPLVEQIVATRGRIIFTGMGKSGFIGRKLVGTFSSLGMPSFFLHPSESLHGDLGMVKSDDLVIVLSKSGAGFELACLVPCLISQSNFVALICCAEGELSKFASLTVSLPFDREACSMNIAPTSSSTMMLAFGDALAIVASSKRGFTQNDFARLHPGGSLGKNLLLSVQSFMYKGDDLPLLSPDADFQQVVLAITSKKLGAGIVVDSENKLLGIITDGDLRRACKYGEEVFSKKACDIMTRNPKTISLNMRACMALELMEEVNITSLIVTEQDRVVGLVHIHDLVKAGISREQRKLLK